MVDAIAFGYIGNVEGIHILETPNVVAVLFGVGAALMVRIDSAGGAEVVLRGHRVKLIQRQNFVAFENA